MRDCFLDNSSVFSWRKADKLLDSSKQVPTYEKKNKHRNKQSRCGRWMIHNHHFNLKKSFTLTEENVSINLVIFRIAEASDSSLAWF